MADEDPERLQQEMFEKAAQPPPEPQPEPVVEPSPPAEPAPIVPPPVEPQPEPGVPTWRLREEAEGRRAAEERARLLESRINEIQTHLKQSEKQPDFFENPNQATEAIVQRYVQQVTAAQEQRDMYNSKMLAKLTHGEDKVTAAEQAFLDARKIGSLDPADYERVVTSPNRWDAVVQWHTKETVTAQVGNDPEAWYKKRREADMDNPEFQAEMLKRMQKTAATRPSETRLPPSLSKTTAAAGNTEKAGDMSDASLFRYAMSNGKER